MQRIGLLGISVLLGLALAASLFAVERELPWHLQKGSKIIGSAVKNLQGETLGRITELVLKLEDNRVAYAVLSFGGFLGLGEKFFAVPLSALKPSAEADTFILDTDKERFKDAPGFDKSSWPLTVNRQWIVTVYTFYRQPVYWEQHGITVVATVENTAGTLTLKTTDGHIVEFTVPQAMLENLLTGEQVEITVRKGSLPAQDGK
jgi:hypothetical protein